MNGAQSANQAGVFPRAAALRLDVQVLLLSLLLGVIAFLVLTPLFLLLLNSFQIGKPGGARKNAGLICRLSAVHRRIERIISQGTSLGNQALARTGGISHGTPVFFISSS